MFPKDTRILVVDDVAQMRNTLKEELEFLGYEELLFAEDGKSALELIRQREEDGAPIGLILCDWNMEGLSGLEVLRLLRASESTAKTPFIMITGEGDFDHVFQAAQQGVNNFIVKPVSAITLKEKLLATWNLLNRS